MQKSRFFDFGETLKIFMFSGMNLKSFFQNFDKDRYQK